jgi:hypothetical protein|tara:strand:- start:3955 stop:4083 length:129 start_codon:yes stop_codon:yes gene_type:complete
MEDGRWNWYGEADTNEEEEYPKGWFWCSERKDFFRYKEWMNL